MNNFGKLNSFEIFEEFLKKERIWNQNLNFVTEFSFTMFFLSTKCLRVKMFSIEVNKHKKVKRPKKEEKEEKNK